MQAFLPYSGPERRVHKVYLTRNSEYHVRKGVCVAVKGRRSNAWIPDHLALRKRLEGLVKDGSMTPSGGDCPLGSRIYFTDGEEEILTSTVVDIQRPQKSVVAQYPPES